MKKGKIYISGGITKVDPEEAKKAFYDAAREWEEMGYDVVNPMAIEHNHDKSWENYMKVDLKAMMDCTHIYMLLGWQDSKGARIEHSLAKDLGFIVFSQDNSAKYV